MIVITAHDYDSSYTYVYGTANSIKEAEEILKSRKAPHPHMTYYRATEWEGMKSVSVPVCFHFREDWMDTLSRYNRTTSSYQNKYIKQVS